MAMLYYQLNTSTGIPMRINIPEKLQRLDRAASLLLQSQETEAVKLNVGNQINIYRATLEQAEGLAEHDQHVHNAIAAIDDFCALTEKTFAHLAQQQGATQ